MEELGAARLYVVPSRKFIDCVLSVLKELVQTKRMEGIYVSINRTAEVMCTLLRQTNVDVDRVHIVDCVSCIVGLTPMREVITVDSPSNLTEISVAIKKAAERIESRNKFLLFDSLPTLLVYNSNESVEKFAHFMISRMKRMGFDIILVTIPTEMSNRTIAIISQFVDQVEEVQ